ncbi:MAG: hypothetical protein K6F99_10395 [Lachnospiraceae bacterium]|nr:hypothetical protein [Lachnospiraceae bacterium]
MLQVPQKVLDVYNSIPYVKEDREAYKGPKDLEGAFTEGFRSGKSSLASMEIEG